MALFFILVEKIRKFSVAFFAEALLDVEFCFFKIHDRRVFCMS